jgi:hypothetical protein
VGPRPGTQSARPARAVPPASKPETRGGAAA